MRHLLFTFIFAVSNVALAQQEAKVDVSAAMSRGAVDCSAVEPKLSVKGAVLSDRASGIRFLYTDGVKFAIKFTGKTIDYPKNLITIQGELVISNESSKAKSTFTMTEVSQDRFFQSAKFTLYRPDGTTFEKSELLRCLNFREIAEILP